jgi:hypothetical protein
VLHAFLFAWAAWADPCEDPAARVEAAEKAVVAGRLADAEVDLGAAEDAFGCSSPPTATLLARMWLAEGAMLSLSGDEQGATDSFSAAHRVDPTFWSLSYGVVLRKAWEETAKQDPGRSRVRLDPVPVHLVGWLDGKVVAFPAEAAAGLHLVQVGPEGGPARYGRVVFLPAGDELVVLHGLREPPEPVVAIAPGPAAPPPGIAPAVASPPPLPLPQEPVIRQDRRPVPILAVAGAASLVLGGAAMAGAFSQHGAIEDATDQTSLYKAYHRQVAFGATSYALLGIGAGAIVLHFAL